MRVYVCIYKVPRICGELDSASRLSYLLSHRRLLLAVNFYFKAEIATRWMHAATHDALSKLPWLLVISYAICWFKLLL